MAKKDLSHALLEKKERLVEIVKKLDWRIDSYKRELQEMEDEREIINKEIEAIDDGFIEDEETP